MKSVPNYGIRTDYTHRLDNDYDVWEMGFGNEFQWEVYLRASWLAQQIGARTIVDLGTGNGGKLMHFFKDYRTVGFDVPYTVDMYLNKAHAGRDWRSKLVPTPCDILISADAIEHFADPDDALQFVEGCNPWYAVISTPNRDVLPASYHIGPPRNKCHNREWSFSEFSYYLHHALGDRFDIAEHFMVKPNDATQVVILRKRVDETQLRA